MRIVVPALLGAVCAAPLPAQTAPEAAPAEVAAAELAFAKLASEKGIAAAFMANLAEGAVILEPGPVDARAHYAKEKDPGLLTWRPAWVGLASSGDLAYSTGPWEYRTAKGQPPLVQGHFLSMWAKQPDGAWKVIFDGGVPHRAAGTEPGGWRAFIPEAAGHADTGDGDLISEDRALNTGQSKLERLAFGATLYRKGSLPLDGRDEVSAALKAEPARAYEPQGSRMSKAADLGCTWGVATAKDGSRVSYLHVWGRPAGAWRLLYDLELPMPAKP